MGDDDKAALVVVQQELFQDLNAVLTRGQFGGKRDMLQRAMVTAAQLTKVMPQGYSHHPMSDELERRSIKPSLFRAPYEGSFAWHTSCFGQEAYRAAGLHSSS